MESFKFSILPAETVSAVDLAHELAHKAHEVQITCLDISSAQFPAQPTWPANLSFGTLHILSDVPNQYVAKFDIIHPRFIAAALWQSPDRMLKFLANVKQMLRPGGWLQWQEISPPMFIMLEQRTDGTYDFHDEKAPPAFVMVVMYIPILQNSQYINALDVLIKDSCDFDIVQGYRLPVRIDRAKYEGELAIWSSTEALAGFAKLSIITQEQLDEITAAFNKFFSDLETGKMIVGMRANTVVARKA